MTTSNLPHSLVKSRSFLEAEKIQKDRYYTDIKRLDLFLTLGDAAYLKNVKSIFMPRFHEYVELENAELLSLFLGYVKHSKWSRVKSLIKKFSATHARDKKDNNLIDYLCIHIEEPKLLEKILVLIHSKGKYDPVLDVKNMQLTSYLVLHRNEIPDKM
jgi:hypothetical protein